MFVVGRNRQTCHLGSLRNRFTDCLLSFFRRGRVSLCPIIQNETSRITRGGGRAFLRTNV